MIVENSLDIEKLGFTTIGDIPVSSLKVNYIMIENVNQFKIVPENYHPESPEYLAQWRMIKHYIVEGMWGQEFGKYRYAPGSLIFYGSFFLIEDTDRKKQTNNIRPTISDLEWEMMYGFLEAEGFSGWANDDEYTSDYLVLKYDENKSPEDQRERELFSSKGHLKKFILPRENIRKLHDKPMGSPLMWNEAKNYSILGSRGGGKSYTVAGAKLLHSIIIDGGRYYDPEVGKFCDYYDYRKVLEGKDYPKAVNVVGSGDTDKSSDLLDKVYKGMNFLATEPEFGVWESPGHPDYAPCPLFKDMAGSILPGNKKNKYRHEYKLMFKGRESLGGTASQISHVSYSTHKTSGAQAGAGGRYLYSVIEEQGLTKNTIDVYNSNNSAVARNGVQFGVQIFLGTSGNINMIVQTKKMFMNPQDYNIVAYQDEWEGLGKDGRIGFFLPYYMTLRQYKDKNGNTDFVKALQHVKEKRAAFEKSDDPSTLRDERMNRPIVPSEMWITNKGYYLPYEQSIARERDLMKDNLYLRIGSPVKLVWDAAYPRQIREELNLESEPFYEFPIATNRLNLDGSIIIYDQPKMDAPNDFYFFVHDPYVSQNLDEGGSVGVTYGLISPKYWDEYMPKTGPLVCSYVSKPLGGLKEYYHNQEKLIQYYGNPVGGLAYEANRGADCRNYYINKGKVEILMPRPVNIDSTSAYEKTVQDYGIVVGGKLPKIQMLDKTSDMLLQDVHVEGVKKKVIETIPDIFLIRQMSVFELEEGDNYDAVSAFILAPKYISELERRLVFESQQKRTNPFIFLSQNPRVFKHPDPKGALRKHIEKYYDDDSTNTGYN